MYRVLVILLLLFSSLEAADQSGFLSFGSGIIKPNMPRPGYLIEGRSPCFFRFFRGQLGVLTEKFKSVYVYGGLRFEQHLLGPLYIYPNFSPGVYFQGEGLCLAYPVEFRSSVDFLCSLHPKLRLGSSFFHISNANIGRRNPGVNGIFFYLSFRIPASPKL